MGTTKHWRFCYEGPRAATDDRECDLCIAVATGKNPKAKRPAALGTPDKVFGTHSGPDGCPAEQIVRRKAAGQSVHCPNHGGLAAALTAHAESHPDHDPSGFGAFTAAVSAHVGAMSTEATHVSVRGSGTYDPRKEDGTPDLSQPYSTLEIHVSAPRSEAEHEQHRLAAVAALTAEERKARGLEAA